MLAWLDPSNRTLADPTRLVEHSAWRALLRKTRSRDKPRQSSGYRSALVRDVRTNGSALQAYLLFTMSMMVHRRKRAAEDVLFRDCTVGVSTRWHQWWSQTGSNRRLPACKAGALPAELWPRLVTRVQRRPAGAWARSSGAKSVVGLGRFELPTSRLSSARSNQLSYRPAEGGVQSAKKEKRRRRCPAFLGTRRGRLKPASLFQKQVSRHCRSSLKRNSSLERR